MTDSPALPAVNRAWHLVTRPVGWPKPEDFALVEAEVPTRATGRCWCATCTSPSTPTCAAA